MKPKISLVAVMFLAVTGCASNAPRKVVNTPAQAPAVSCETAKKLPPKLAGAARTDSSDQPVLIVGCDDSK